MEHVEVLRHMKETIKAIAPSEVAALDAAIASLSAPTHKAGDNKGADPGHVQGSEWVLVPKDAIERAIETLENDGDEHGEGRNLRAMLDAAPQPPAEAQPVAWQFQDRDGKWHGFTDERHRQNTIADGSWPVRALYTAPPSAPVGVEEDMVNLANRIAASSHPDDPRLEVAYSIARHLGLGWPAAQEGSSDTFAQGRLEGLSMATAECDRLTTALDYSGKEYRRPAGADQCARALRSLYANLYRELYPDPKLNELSGNSGQLPDIAQQPAAVDGDNPYPAPRNRQEAAALAKLALAYLGVTSAHIDAAVARCETDLAAQQGGSDNE